MSNDMQLCFRPMLESDLPAKVRWANDPRVNQWVGMLEPVNLAGTQRWFENHQRDPQVLLYTIVYDDQAIGFVKLGRSDDGREGELLGIVIGEPEYWGRGLGKAAIREMLRIAFEIEGWERLWGYWSGWNHRSIAVHQQLGFVIAGIAEQKRQYLDGTWHDQLILEITRARWAALS